MKRFLFLIFTLALLTIFILDIVGAITLTESQSKLGYFLMILMLIVTMFYKKSKNL